ncbi:hypothetical protein CVT24_008379 [Panaeolus cyanescens]|uniref:UDP-N-acetylglucosamine transferase subunit ALG13 n=1 Tax=Panaeolus cyanescens TaxID=181874 RepID=A0A409W0Q7_9AGAR|nr:hypothetical protein CVT24_008379 [Panaeolus cyanescens]
MTIPDVQKAWVVVRSGKPAKAVVLKADWPVPKQLKQGEVLVKIQAAAFNPVGWKMMKLPNIFSKRPHVAEHDISGVVVDANGTSFSEGDNVFGLIPVNLQLKTRQGALAEYARIPADHLMLRPPNVTPVEASGLTLAGITSYQALFHIGKLEAHQTIFINGGSTSVGAFAIQLAKARGAKVVATASSRNEEFVRRMGADEFIDYTKEPLVPYLVKNPPPTKYNIIYDAVGLLDPSLFTSSSHYLAPNGIFISTGPLPKSATLSEIWNLFRTAGAMTIPSWLGNVNRKYSLVLLKHDANDWVEFQKLVAEGSVKPIVDSVYGFEDVMKGYERILSTRAAGKVLLVLQPSIMLAFVTVGSTKFDKLIQAIFTEEVLSNLKKKGYTNLIVQCGKSLFEFADKITGGREEHIERSGVRIEFWQYKSSLEKCYKEADLVISHAGSGTIVDVLRMGKVMIVVPNDTLADNHQEELASALQEMKYLKSTSVEHLAQTIIDFDANSFEPFPPFQPTRFAKDYAISIATIHHLATHERRRNAVKRLLQAVSPSHGRVLIYVWAIEQDELSKRKVVETEESQLHPQGKDVVVPWVLSKQLSKASVTDAQSTEPQVFNRYYHMFAKGELPLLVREAAEELGLRVGVASKDLEDKLRGVEVVQDGWERSNYYVELRLWQTCM